MFELKNKKIHFIGIGGVGVNALAKFAIENGASVSGSDAKFNSLCNEISKLGAKVYEGENAQFVDDVDVVVYSSAIKSRHSELSRARELNIDTYERQEFLHEIASMFSSVAGIAGTHGKTTTTAMLAHILARVGKKFVAMIGGESVEFGNYVNNSNGEHDTFIVEACEYKRNFLTLKPTVAVVTNVECDHPDCYVDFESVRSAFDEYLSEARTKIYETEVCDCGHWSITFETDRGRDIFSAKKIGRNCRLYKDDVYVGEITLTEGGDYNLKNATFAVATAYALGVNPEDAIYALKTYGGVKRRFERANDIDGVPAYFDFAHHPTEIKCVLERAKEFGKILAVFQPHTYSRTKAYFDAFAEVFGANPDIGTLVIMPTYAARERLSDGCDSDELFREIVRRYHKQDAFLADGANSAIKFVKTFANSHGIVLFIGAGDIYDIKQML